MCIIDAKEVHAYTIEAPSERQKYYSQCADEFEKAFSMASDEDVKAELLHHQGKAQRRCGQYEKALECFIQLLVLKPEWHATHGQIAHLGTQNGVSHDIKKKGEESLRILIAEILHDASLIPLRVSLAALTRLRSYQNIVQELLNKPDEVKKLADIIASSALEGFGQFYEAFVSFTSKFGYRYSSYCIDLAESFPEILAMPPEMVEKSQWVSACEALTNTSIAAERVTKTELSTQFAKASLQFADAISRTANLRSYDARAVCKAYMAANHPQQALAAIAKVSEGQIDHWLLYRKSQAQLAIDKPEDALTSAKNAFDLARNDPKATKMIASYHEQLSKCHEANHHIIPALDEARLALAECTDDQYRKTIADRVSILEGMSS